MVPKLLNDLRIIEEQTVKVMAFLSRANFWPPLASKIFPLLAVLVLIPDSPANACACCADRGQRTETIGKVAEMEQEILQAIRFGPKAELVTREGDELGIATPSSDGDFYGYKLTGTNASKIWTFQLTEKGAVRGTISFPIPERLERFEIDPRDGVIYEGAGGPLLYKEWRLSGEAILSNLAVEGEHTATARLILQGRGISCPDINDFKHWSLLINGEKVQFGLIGDLTR